MFQAIEWAWPRSSAPLPEPAHDRAVVAEEPVAVQLDHVREEQGEVVERVGPLGVAGELDALPGGEAAVNATFEHFELHLQRLHQLRVPLALRVFLRLLEAVFQLRDRLFEIVAVAVHPTTCLSPAGGRAVSQDSAGRHQSTIVTSVPTGTMSKSSSASLFVIRTQPAVACLPMASGSIVP